jgi:hypothetical protein
MNSTGVPRVHHLRRAEVGLAVERRVAGGEKERVALAQRDLQRLGQAQHHLAAGLGAARLHEAEVPRGDVRVQGEVELAHAPRRAPVTEERPDVSAAALAAAASGRESTRAV